MDAKTKKGIIVSGIVLAIVGLAYYIKKKNDNSKNNSDNALSWDNMKKLAEENADFDPFPEWTKFKKELDQQKKQK